MATIAKILSRTSHAVPGKLLITELLFEVPRDYSKPDGGSIKLFARSARKLEKPADPTDDSSKKQLPWLCFLQGGPGFPCPSPQYTPWTNQILDRGYEILCLDQRGTGLSTPLSASTLGLRGDDPVQANYMKSFRADSIVKDCEAIRLALTADFPKEKKKWSIMGQSFGGFCAVTYLSFHPEGLREAFLFGGLPPLVDGPDPVYERTYKKVAKRNKAYYEKYPEDVERVKAIVKLLQRFGNSTVRTPTEGALSARRFQTLGLAFGAHGGIDSVHEIVLKAWMDLQMFGHLTRNTVSAIDQSFPLDTSIIYAVLHEPIYCQGTASNWSAERVLAKYPEFSLDTDGPIYFTGEMIYPFQFEDYNELAKLLPQANMLASDSSWPAVYDEAQLAKNDVPVYAAVYMDDMYVDFDFSVETASKIKGCKTFITNAMYHDAVRSKMEEVTKSLFALRDDCID
ncbi:proline iminopeptidase [Aulographum hederae CBS 113979]|uniref:Proline iminopeptidase n=1 Tax=Aulographum hederae CBS 113979 TaxID=1176131 RepID=A0A6G1H554_9PEZI|nr:proline iminopeptidase [Aulographum hederae CBS 113979]